MGCPSGMCWGGGRLGLGLGAMHRFGFRVVEGVFSVVKRLVNVLARFNMVKEALMRICTIFLWR